MILEKGGVLENKGHPRRFFCHPTSSEIYAANILEFIYERIRGRT